MALLVVFPHSHVLKNSLEFQGLSLAWVPGSPQFHVLFHGILCSPPSGQKPRCSGGTGPSAFQHRREHPVKLWQSIQVLLHPPYVWRDRLLPWLDKWSLIMKPNLFQLTEGRDTYTMGGGLWLSGLGLGARDPTAERLMPPLGSCARPLTLDWSRGPALSCVCVCISKKKEKLNFWKIAFQCTCILVQGVNKALWQFIGKHCFLVSQMKVMDQSSCGQLRHLLLNHYLFMVVHHFFLYRWLSHEQGWKQKFSRSALLLLSIAQIGWRSS